MGFFGGDSDGDVGQAESRARIEAGGIPLGAEERLRQLAGEGALFTSGLSVNEFALLDRLGPRPLAQVMGASVVRAGWQYLPALAPGMGVVAWYEGRIAASRPTITGPRVQNPFGEASRAQVRNYRWRQELICELDVLTGAWDMARRRALDRLTEEAVLVGADAVVGVHLSRGDHAFGKGTIEYAVSGTAIRVPHSAGTSSPALSNVSAQDYWRLRVAGHEPAGFVAATSVVFASASRATRLRRARTTSRNQELEELSHGFHAARESVRAKLRAQASEAHGAGVVGVELSHSVRRGKFALGSSVSAQSHRGWHRGRFGLPYRVSGRDDAERAGWVISMHGTGTAIKRREAGSRSPVKMMIGMGER